LREAQHSLGEKSENGERSLFLKMERIESSLNFASCAIRKKYLNAKRGGAFRLFVALHSLTQRDQSIHASWAGPRYMAGESDRWWQSDFSGRSRG
jgi:hypothetical protein